MNLRTAAFALYDTKGLIFIAAIESV